MKGKKRIAAGVLCMVLAVTNVWSEELWAEASGLRQEETESIEETKENGEGAGESEGIETEFDGDTGIPSEDMKDVETLEAVETEEGTGKEAEETVSETEMKETITEIFEETQTEEEMTVEAVEIGADIETETETERETVEEETDYELDIAVSGDDIASGSYGNVIWVIDKDGKLTVTGTGDFAEPVDDRGDDEYSRMPWYEYRTFIISAEVNVTGMTDASWMFYECENMVKVNLQGLDTSKVKNMSHMFWDCASLANLDLSSFDTSNVISMREMFGGWREDRRLNNLDLTSFNTENVTNMSGMFEYSNILNIDLSNFNTENVTDMSRMFEGGVGD